ncbi:hypothetical protein JKP88DRAFT_247636 [Tribonema minus]|uniref:C2H2-type domain-containing protein n=1 Tax=Tribonema minus TaxID=303371 RepID=A0A835YQ85_9STRA|nr:hypothetical protein JKP88DRAFT_247636 [Tribonema minus]
MTNSSEKRRVKRQGGIRKRTHTDKKPFKCDFEGCDYECQTSGSLKDNHTHTGEKPHKCDFESCDSKCNLVTHKRTHTGEKPFECDFEGCGYTCARSGTFVTHKRIHTGEKPYKCDFEGCGYTCARSGTLVTHKRIHTGEKPLKCDFQGCEYASAQATSLASHKRTHSGEKPFKCDFEGCSYTCADSGNFTRHKRYPQAHPHRSLVTHKRTHTGEKPYQCDFEGCDYASAQSQHLANHQHAMHSKEGAKRQLKQQMRVVKVLKEAGYTVDEECTIQYTGCVPDPDRHHARLDVYVVTITSCILIVEVDEEAHASYLVSCEITRMLQMHEAILTRGYTVPVVFVRYSPNGAITRDGVYFEMTRKEREVALLEFLGRVRAGQQVFEEPLNLVYLCYPTANGLPTVCEDPHFDEGMIGTVRSSV